MWWARQDLNLGPTDYESAALTAELRAQSHLLINDCTSTTYPISSWVHWDHNHAFFASSDTTFRRYSVGKCVYLLVVFNEVWPTHFLIRSPGTLFC